MSIKTVIFDLGRVVIDFDHLAAAKRISLLTKKTPQEIYDLFFDSPVTGKFEEGLISPEDFFKEVSKMLGLKISFDEFLPIWNEIFMLTDKNRGVIKLATLLKERYKIAVLSNINQLHHDYLKKEYKVFLPFHKVLTSYEMKLRKPDPLIYKKAMNILKVNDPSEIFYTDDRPELIDSARSLGIKAFVFSGVRQLKKDLVSSGVIIS